MCSICASKFRDDLDKKINWRPDRVVKWANKRGLKIDEKQLESHFTEHTNPIPAKTKAKRPVVKKEKAVESNVKNKTSSDTKPDEPAKPRDDDCQSSLTDNQFLNEVVGRVFDNLAAGEFNLKIEHGFKAIELKQKLSENTNVESLLLELMNEIRTQELAARN